MYCGSRASAPCRSFRLDISLTSINARRRHPAENLKSTGPRPTFGSRLT
jgi:hypothetical protein